MLFSSSRLTFTYFFFRASSWAATASFRFFERAACSARARSAALSGYLISSRVRTTRPDFVATAGLVDPSAIPAMALPIAGSIAARESRTPSSSLAALPSARYARAASAKGFPAATSAARLPACSSFSKRAALTFHCRTEAR